MAATKHLHEYLDSVEHVPTDVKRTLATVGSIDTQVESDLAALREECAAFLEGLRRMAPEERVAKLKEIDDKFKSSYVKSEEKVGLATKLYNSIDQHIQKLDERLRSFDSETDDKHTNKHVLHTERSQYRDDDDRPPDMPVDPNEPTYCLCHQCPTEWFHFACVGLKEKPKGKWFCPRCSAERTKRH